MAALEIPRVVQCEERDREKEVSDTRDEEARQMRVASFEETRQMRGARDRDSAIIAGRAELEARKSALDQHRVEEELVYIYQGTDCSEYTGAQSGQRVVARTLRGLV